MPGCAVATCMSYSRYTKGKGIIYHAFPSDVKTQKLWVLKCRRGDKFNHKTAKVCSLHFDDDSYVRDLQAELLGLPPKRRLKEDAIPTLNLPGLNPTQSTSSTAVDLGNPGCSPAASRYEAWQIGALEALEAINNVSPKKRRLDRSVSTEDLPSNVASSSEMENLMRIIGALEKQNEKLLNENKKLKIQNEAIHKKYKILRRAETLLKKS